MRPPMRRRRSSKAVTGKGPERRSRGPITERQGVRIIALLEKLSGQVGRLVKRAT